MGKSICVSAGPVSMNSRCWMQAAVCAAIFAIQLQYILRPSPPCPGAHCSPSRQAPAGNYPGLLCMVSHGGFWSQPWRPCGKAVACTLWWLVMVCHSAKGPLKSVPLFSVCLLNALPGPVTPRGHGYSCYRYCFAWTPMAPGWRGLRC